MPIYEYECTKCGHQTEAWQKFSDAPLEECEICHGRLRKIISHSTFHLKGTGWYVTDYASKTGGSRAEASRPAHSSKPNGTAGGMESSAKKAKDTKSANASSMKKAASGK